MNNSRITELANKIHKDTGFGDLMTILMIISILIELARLIQTCKDDHQNIMSCIKAPRVYERIWLIRKCKMLLPKEQKHLAPKLIASILKVFPEYSLEDFYFLSSGKI